MLIDPHITLEAACTVQGAILSPHHCKADLHRLGMVWKDFEEIFARGVNNVMVCLKKKPIRWNAVFSDHSKDAYRKTRSRLLYLCLKSESALFLLNTSANLNPVTFFSEAAEPHHHTALADGNSRLFYRQRDGCWVAVCSQPLRDQIRC